MPATTPYYAFPVPIANDPADAPHDFLALAQKIEDTLKNGYTMPNGGLTVGDYAVSAQAAVALRRLVGVDTTTASFYLHDNGGYLAIRLLKNGAEVNRLSMALDGSVNLALSGVFRPIPFAAHTSTTFIAFANTVSSTMAVTFPVSRFTQPPIVTVTPNGVGSSVYACSTSSVTATGCTIAAVQINAVAANVPINVHYQAIQMTPSSGSG